MKNFLAPQELAQSFIAVGKAKATNTFAKLLLLGILAGVYIGFAAHLATTVATGWDIAGATALFGLKKFFIGAVFSVGLMLVIIPGSELFTGNNLMTIALFEKEISFKGMMRNWVIVWIANLLGSILLAWFIAKMSGLLSTNVGATAINIAAAKTAATDGHNLAFFFRAIGCNWLVCLAVMLAMSAQDVVGKIFACFFPIMAFVTSGFEHCVANMYFIPAGIFAKSYPDALAASKIADNPDVLNWGTFFTQNIGIVTLGNIVGGAIFCGIIYWFIYVKGVKRMENGK